MRILVTDSDNRSALAATRALGRAGHEVFVAGSAQPSLSSVSRYCRGSDVHPNPAKSPAGFVEAIIEIATRRRVDIVMPMTEITTLLLTQERSRLPPNCRLPFPSTQSVATASNKAEVIALALELGVPAPRTVVLPSLEEGRRLAPSLEYPIVLKAARSRVWTGTQWLSTSVTYAATIEELLAKLEHMPAEVFPILAQERIDGPGIGVFLCWDDQGVVASFAHRRIREKPPSGGQSVLCESTAVEPAALEYASRLLRRLQWHGVAMVEFKRDLRDGSLRLMEINGRFWGSLQLAIDAGVDFPNLLVDLSCGRRPASPPQYHIGVRCRWLWGDIDSLLAVLFRSRSAQKLPPSHPGRLRTLLQFLVPWRPGLKYELERWDDLRPAWLETRRRLLNQAH